MSKGVLVVGGSPAGVQAALDLAEAGIKVHLVERLPFLGGDGAGMPQHLLRPRLLEATRHPNIQVLTNAEVTRLTGEGGHFRAEVQRHPRYVDPSTCTACGECVAVCPVTVQRPGQRLDAAKAIYKPGGAVPTVFAIEKRGPAPCKVACPAGIHVQGYVALIAQGKFQEALALIREAIPFPSVCGRVCHHPCESQCRRGEYDEPIAIRDLKRFVADYCEGRGTRGDSPIRRFADSRVAIVGSGPAGLTAAYFLAREGYPVTVFEALPVAGGMMAVGIPEYRLPKDVLRREIAEIEALGVEIRLNAPVGGDGGPSLEELRRDYDAVFVAVGAHKSRRLGVPGEDLEGVLPGVDFLRRVNLGQEVAVGRRVIIVGGGNVAVDSAMVARRLGAERVTILYRRSRAEMPANPWDVEEAEEEGIALHFLASPVRVLGRDGRVAGLECVRMELGQPDESGRRRPIPIPGSEFAVEADTVIVAIGQAVEAPFLEAEGWRLERGGRIAVDPLTLATDVPGVFAGGDAVTGPATVIEAIAAGKRAAESIRRYLRGEDLAAGRTLEAPDISDIEYYTPPIVEPQARARMPKLPLAERRGFAEINLGFDEAQAVAEAKRCLSCGVCSECLECVKVCEAGAIDHAAQGERLILDVGAIILADGGERGAGKGVYAVEPDDLLGASAAAAKAMMRVKGYGLGVKGVSEQELLSPLPHPLSPIPHRLSPKIGVFVCRCGGEVSHVLDVERLKEHLSALPGVALVQDLDFACHEEGAQAIGRAAVERGLDGIVLAACSCCALDQICYGCTSQRLRCKGRLLNDPLDRLTRLTEFVNIREQCAWVHADEPERATAKAAGLIAAAVARVRRGDGRAGAVVSLDRAVLVVGSGPAGDRCAEALSALGLRTVWSKDLPSAVGGCLGSFRALIGGSEWRAGAIVLAPADEGERAALEAAFGVEGLFRTGDFPWSPLEGRLAGVFICDPAGDPEVVGLAVAAKVAARLGRGWIAVAPTAARVDPSRCRACGTCEEICEFHAIRVREDGRGVLVAQVDEAACRGCGTCAAHCPSGAITAGYSTDEQIEAMLGQLLGCNR